MDPELGDPSLSRVLTSLCGGRRGRPRLPPQTTVRRVRPLEDPEPQMSLQGEGPILQGVGRDLVDGSHPGRVTHVESGVDDAAQGEAQAGPGRTADVGLLEAGSIGQLTTFLDCVSALVTLQSVLKPNVGPSTSITDVHRGGFLRLAQVVQSAATRPRGIQPHPAIQHCFARPALRA